MPRLAFRRHHAVAALTFLCATALAVAPVAQTPAPPAVHIHPDLRAAADVLRQGRFPTRPVVKPPATPTWIQRTIPGPQGAPDVRIYVINGGAKTTAPRPAILQMHGGGYTGGTAAIFIPALQPLAAALDCVIVAVDYRLAPATRYPGSLEDNYTALKWLHRNAAELGVDPSRLAVMGDSAGGGHAAMLTLAARDRREVPLIYQALIYPMLDDRTGTSRQVPAHIGTLVWTREANRNGWTALLGVPAGGAQVPEGSVPARVANVAGLPPAFIAVGDLDLFVEEDLAYAQRLMIAGVPVELNVIPGAFHGFDVFEPNAPVTMQLRASLVNALKAAFSGAFARP